MLSLQWKLAECMGLKEEFSSAAMIWTITAGAVKGWPSHMTLKEGGVYLIPQLPALMNFMLKLPQKEKQITKTIISILHCIQ